MIVTTSILLNEARRTAGRAHNMRKFSMRTARRIYRHLPNTDIIKYAVP